MKSNLDIGAEERMRREEPEPRVLALDAELRREYFSNIRIMPWIVGSAALVGFGAAYVEFHGSPILLVVPLAFVLLSVLLRRLLTGIRERSLRFEMIVTTNSAAENSVRVIEFARNADWQPVEIRPCEFMAFRRRGFPTTMKSWGERVSVGFEGSAVFVNSICDPEERFSMTTWGRNSENISAIKRAVTHPGMEDSASNADHD